MKKKPVKIWVVLLVAPFVLLVGAVVVSLLGRTLFGSEGNPMRAIFNIISLLAGMLGVLTLIGMPIWIIMLVLAMKHNQEIVTTASPVAVPPPAPAAPDPNNQNPQPPLQ